MAEILKQRELEIGEVSVTGMSSDSLDSTPASMTGMSSDSSDSTPSTAESMDSRMSSGPDLRPVRERELEIGELTETNREQKLVPVPKLTVAQADWVKSIPSLEKVATYRIGTRCSMECRYQVAKRTVFAKHAVRDVTTFANVISAIEADIINGVDMSMFPDFRTNTIMTADQLTQLRNLTRKCKDGLLQLVPVSGSKRRSDDQVHLRWVKDRACEIMACAIECPTILEKVTPKRYSHAIGCIGFDSMNANVSLIQDGHVIYFLAEKDIAAGDTLFIRPPQANSAFDRLRELIPEKIENVKYKRLRESLDTAPDLFSVALICMVLSLSGLHTEIKKMGDIAPAVLLDASMKSFGPVVLWHLQKHRPALAKSLPRWIGPNRDALIEAWSKK